MSTVTKVLLIIVVVLIALIGSLIFLGTKVQKKQALQKEQMDAMAQTVSMLVIDKKHLKIKDSGLPPVVIQQTPKYLRWSKLPVVKAKVGPKVMTLACDEAVFQLIPVKREVKAVVSGIYITGVKSARGGLETPVKKKGFFKRLLKK